MPYEEYLASASTSAYASTTFSQSSVNSLSTTFYAVTVVGGETTTAVAGLYFSQSYTRDSRSTTYSYSDEFGSASSSASYQSQGVSSSEESYGPQSYSISSSESSLAVNKYGDNIGASGGTLAATASWTATGSWNADLSSFDAEGKGENGYIGSYTAADAFTTVNIVDTGSSTFTIEPALKSYYFAAITSTTTSSVNLRKTTESTSTFYGPLQSGSTTYTYIRSTQVSHVLSDIKTTINDSKLFWSVEGQSRTFNIEWLGYSGGGAQNLGLVYTETGENKDISEYATVLMETDLFTSSNKNESFSFGPSFSGSYNGTVYTLTYDSTTLTALVTTATELSRESVETIDFFTYGFIKTYTAVRTLPVPIVSVEELELTSASMQSVATNSSNTAQYVISGVSYSAVQEILTTSEFTQFFWLQALSKATSSTLRGLFNTTASYSYRRNVTANAGSGRSYTFAPTFTNSLLSIRTPESSNPDTFYTEEATFGSFAQPSYTQVFTNYSPSEASLVFLALVALNTEENIGFRETKDAGPYPSWISVYNGTFGVDRASSTNSSVTVFQSSSYSSGVATSVYQTVSYFVGNNPDSATTRSTSIVISLEGSATSVSRLVRTKAENLTSAYMSGVSYLPSIPISGSNLVFTHGLQSSAFYNIGRMLINASTTGRSTFANSATSTSPASVSKMTNPIFRNKIRIDSTYNYSETGSNSFSVPLLRYSNVTNATSP